MDRQVGEDLRISVTLTFKVQERWPNVNEVLKAAVVRSEIGGGAGPAMSLSGGEIWGVRGGGFEGGAPEHRYSVDL
jgi:hypothetical protein